MLSKSEYEDIVVKTVVGRYVSNVVVLDFLSGLDDSYKIETIGQSVQGRPISSIEIGHGPNRILMWSQMHGNESTTTKAVLDLLNYFTANTEKGQEILKSCSLLIIPVLSPDGANAYTRLNANKVDLNRDANDLTQPESVVLREVFNAFKPHFAFNLHGQRTIYNVGATGIPATVSFLSPSVDESRKVSETRKTAMQLIAAMNRMLQSHIPGSVGRYDDGFNSNCVGDTFQSLKCPTILFEAGHFPNDYQREEVRRLLFLSILEALQTIGANSISDYSVEEYFNIPENGKQFFDVLIKNIHNYASKFKEGDSAGILFDEVLKDGKIDFVPKIKKIGVLNSYFGHETYDCVVEKDLAMLNSQPQLCSIINNI